MPSGVSKTGAALYPPSWVETMSTSRSAPSMTCTVEVVPPMYPPPIFESSGRFSLLVDTSSRHKIPYRLARQNILPYSGPTPARAITPTK